MSSDTNPYDGVRLEREHPNPWEVEAAGVLPEEVAGGNMATTAGS